MDDNQNKAARKARDLSNQLEEEDLWDLEDSWDEEDEEPAAAGTEAPEEEADDEAPLEEEPLDEADIAEEDDVTAEEEPEETSSDSEDIEEEPEDSIEDEEEVLEDDELESDDEPTETADLFEDIEDEPEIEDEFEDIADEPEETEPEDTDIDVVAESEDIAPITEPAEEPTQPIPAESAAAEFKKPSLSSIEKISLSAFVVVFLGLAIWGYMFLHERNNLGKPETTLNFPVKGKHTTVSDFHTFWQSPEDAQGIKLGAKVIPGASITLDDDSNGSGALRIYFLNAEKNTAGDTVTISFSDGKFSNGKKTIEVLATDGFHQEGDFSAYVLDHTLAWRIRVLEADSANASGDDFSEIIDTVIEPVRR
ncbi:hypothetical protein NT6N_31310 [Oceaniferula spumae]|uniref:Uncharacterized protein n=1 Tax=Oceaniferula spumae TaxID=2979115 RepID=A0AAT9FQ21_9BACT